MGVQQVIHRNPQATPDQLIPLLQAVQEEDGFISNDAIRALARHVGLPPSKVYGVATFYNGFRFHPFGRFHIQVCRGTACHVKGSSNVLDHLRRSLGVGPGETTRDGLFSLEVVACIGACGLAPVVSVNGRFHAGVTRDRLDAILAQYRKEAQDHAHAA